MILLYSLLERISLGFTNQKLSRTSPYHALSMVPRGRDPIGQHQESGHDSMSTDVHIHKVPTPLLLPQIA